MIGFVDFEQSQGQGNTVFVVFETHRIAHGMGSGQQGTIVGDIDRAQGIEMQEIGISGDQQRERDDDPRQQIAAR